MAMPTMEYDDACTRVVTLLARPATEEELGDWHFGGRRCEGVREEIVVGMLVQGSKAIKNLAQALALVSRWQDPERLV